MRISTMTQGEAKLPRDAGVDPEPFRYALGRHAAGVVVVTAAPPTGPVGVTATSFTGVSLHPPLVSFYIDAASNTWPGIRDSGVFAVNILGEEQHDIAARFAAKDVDRFAPPTPWQYGPEGLPLIEDAAGHLMCLRHDLLAVGDHWLVVGRVAATDTAASESQPLLYHRGRYGRFDA